MGDFIGKYLFLRISQKGAHHTKLSKRANEVYNQSEV